MLVLTRKLKEQIVIGENSASLSLPSKGTRCVWAAKHRTM